MITRHIPVSADVDLSTILDQFSDEEIVEELRESPRKERLMGEHIRSLLNDSVIPRHITLRDHLCDLLNLSRATPLEGIEKTVHDILTNKY